MGEASLQKRGPPRKSLGWVSCDCAASIARTRICLSSRARARARSAARRPPQPWGPRLARAPSPFWIPSTWGSNLGRGVGGCLYSYAHTRILIHFVVSCHHFGMALAAGPGAPEAAGRRRARRRPRGAAPVARPLARRARAGAPARGPHGARHTSSFKTQPPGAGGRLLCVYVCLSSPVSPLQSLGRGAGARGPAALRRGCPRAAEAPRRRRAPAPTALRRHRAPAPPAPRRRPSVPLTHEKKRRGGGGASWPPNAP